MMALHVGLRRATAPAAIVGYSGLSGRAAERGDLEAFAAEIKSRPPVLLVHGDRDDLIPPQALFQATQGLAALGVSVEWHLSPGDRPRHRRGRVAPWRRVPGPALWRKALKKLGVLTFTCVSSNDFLANSA